MDQSSVVPADCYPSKDSRRELFESLAPTNSEKFILPKATGQPIDIYKADHGEELAFVKLYPSGKNGLNEPDRKVKCPLQLYLQTRILNKDPRWRNEPLYLFWATHVWQKIQLKNLNSIATRIFKSSSTDNTCPLTVTDLRNTDINNPCEISNFYSTKTTKRYSCILEN